MFSPLFFLDAPFDLLQVNVFLFSKMHFSRFSAYTDISCVI
jgi:hypothetical protein